MLELPEDSFCLQSPTEGDGGGSEGSEGSSEMAVVLKKPPIETDEPQKALQLFDDVTEKGDFRNMKFTLFQLYKQLIFQEMLED